MPAWLFALLWVLASSSFGKVISKRYIHYVKPAVVIVRRTSGHQQCIGSPKY